MEKEENHQALADLVQAMSIEQSLHAKPILPNPFHHLHTLWLFTVNDIKSILIPQSAFGIITALSGPVLTTNASPSLTAVLSTLPRVLCWTYLNLLTFDISNQRLPTSLVEDSVNKPWRALPSKRLSMAQARRLLCFLIPFVILITKLWVGGYPETLVMMSLTWMYNDLHGADEHYVVRNLINAAGFMTYNYGTSRVAVGSPHVLNAVMEYQWVPMVGGVVLTTLQMQDMSDQKGDAERNRGTLPLVWGDGAARWSIAVPVLAWSFICPAFWQLGIFSSGFALPVIVGGVLAGRVLLLRGVECDKVTWKVWCAWMMVLYSLPLFKDHSVFARAFDGFAPFQMGVPGCLTNSAHLSGINVLTV